MPTYEYQCRACQRVFEIRQRISDAPLTTCDACGGEVRRLLSAAPFILKGAGWYVTDYPSAARKKALDSEKGGTDTKPAGEKSSGDTKPAGEKSSGDTKSSGQKSSGEQSSTPPAPSTTAATSTSTGSSGSSGSTD